jgi:hypothetical protein
MSKQRIAQAAFLTIVGLVVFFVIYTILKRPEPTSPPLVITLQPRPTVEPPTPTPATINVYVSGAVNKPDVYTLPANAIVKDAVTAAGGATADADLDRINLATKLADQMQVYVPRKGEAEPPARLGRRTRQTARHRPFDRRGHHRLPHHERSLQANRRHQRGEGHRRCAVREDQRADHGEAVTSASPRPSSLS